MNTFARLLEYARQDAHLSYGELAQKSGLSKGYIHALENGKNIPTIDTVAKLANALQIDSGYFMPVGTLNDFGNLSAREVRLIEALREHRYPDALKILANYIEDGE